MTTFCCLLVLVSAPPADRAASATQGAPRVALPPGGSLRQPIEIIPPAIDEAALSPERQAIWRDVRARFIATASHASRSQRLLDELSFRLRLRGFALRDSDVARAARMRESVDESIVLITAFDFERAFQALARADYEHARLRDVVGQ